MDHGPRVFLQTVGRPKANTSYSQIWWLWL